MKNVFLSKVRVQIAAVKRFVPLDLPTISEDAQLDFETRNILDEDKLCYKSILELSKKHPDLLAQLERVNLPDTSNPEMSDADRFETFIPRENRNMFDLSNVAENLKEKIDSETPAKPEDVKEDDA